MGAINPLSPAGGEGRGEGAARSPLPEPGLRDERLDPPRLRQLQPSRLGQRQTQQVARLGAIGIRPVAPQNRKVHAATELTRIARFDSSILARLHCAGGPLENVGDPP